MEHSVPLGRAWFDVFAEASRDQVQVAVSTLSAEVGGFSPIFEK